MVSTVDCIILHTASTSQLQGEAKKQPPIKISLWIINIFGELFRGYSWDILPLVLQTANFSISSLVLQKQLRFKHKRRFCQVHKHKNQIKTILHANFKLTHLKRKKTRHDTQERPLQWMFKVSAASVDVSLQTLAKAGIGLKTNPLWKLIIYLNQLNNFARNFQ